MRKNNLIVSELKLMATIALLAITALIAIDRYMPDDGYVSHNELAKRAIIMEQGCSSCHVRE